jgi:hypothetical protein
MYMKLTCEHFHRPHLLSSHMSVCNDKGMGTEHHLCLYLRGNGNLNQDRVFQAQEGKVCQGTESDQADGDSHIPSLHTELHSEV